MSGKSNYFTKPRRNVNLWVIYIKIPCEKLFFPITDVHGSAVAYGSKKSAGPALYEAKRMNGKRNAYLQRVGPIC